VIRIIGVRPWAVVLGILMVVGVWTAAFFRGPSPPLPPKACADKVLYLHPGGDATCDPGQLMEVWPAGTGHALVKCICQRGSK
jgi:hypothetical protein